MDSAITANTADSAAAVKRKRSPSVSASLSAPAPKAAKTSNQLSINYLARQSPEDLPLINKDDTLPNLIHLLSAYSNILDRHESLASNLGARPLGPILIKRFERCFDAPPKVVASHHKNASANNPDDSHQITWLEVIEFARSHPTQFTLSTFSEGRRVCQFYYPQKQLRVQISEEDFLFINSGRCQELIPPLPIWEDEEKEVGTCDVLEAKLKELTNVADMVAARTRQLSHRLKGRRAAILERRAEGGSGTPAKAPSSMTTTIPPPSSTASASAPASASGFVAVNTTANAPPSRASGESAEPSLGSSAAVRNELLRHFESLPHNQGQGRAQTRHHGASGSIDASSSSQKLSNVDTAHEGATSNTSSLSPVPTTLYANEHLPYTSADSARTTTLHRPSSSTGNPYTITHAPLKHNFSRPLPPALESSQPFRPLCQAHMDSLPRGHRVLPPCDRCRRLRMDCVKNLTSCAGCTRKHARCHWRDVSRDELGALDHLMDSTFAGIAASYSPSHADSARVNGYANGGSEAGDHHDDSDDDDSNPLEDLEALGEQEEQENQQIREDAEGLRNAKELARLGYEDSMRSTANPVSDSVVSETICAKVDEPKETADTVGQPEAVPGRGYDPVTDTPHRRLPSDDEIQVQHPGMTAEPPKVVQAGDMQVSHGSFRAVNGSAIDSGAVLNGTGWRAV
ncbi:hypothetical protein AC578_2323 [Pseudocercospora eumusae]|uniref:Zn(2)-C6 fungal-type domain-containing protein n=1 Tax=Pseudocercospora eumusae TaxID=321146 RepID=A0A139HXY0_9PEZI|nr:hypothetical protein AC578_2323 [Pseudocercospora eumusae]